MLEIRWVLNDSTSRSTPPIRRAPSLLTGNTRSNCASRPSWLLFESQGDRYRESVLPAGVPTVSVEAGTTLGWDRYADACVGIGRFGASAPGERVYKELGVTAENVAAKVKALLAD